MWFILAMATPSVRDSRRVPRHQPLRCRSRTVAVAPRASRRAIGATEPGLPAPVEPCRLMLVVGCLPCQRYVGLEPVGRRPGAKARQHPPAPYRRREFSTLLTGGDWKRSHGKE